MMINSSIYMHDSDKMALQALKAIPGFSQFLKAFMKIWNERQFRLMNMSSRLRLSEVQMPKYYKMLPPICEKLGIDVPELYLELNVVANSYTYGDTKPFIVLTSGLLETLPDELIPTVLAHECGHIACHHVLYTTMGDMILKGLIFQGLYSMGGLASLVTTPLQVAFYYWMRGSEYSADRAAMICDGSPDKMTEVCMRLAGYDKDIDAEVSIEAFMEQAAAYKEMVKSSKWDKTLEFMLYSRRTHPLTAVRAYECREWGKSELYSKINRYLSGNLEALSDSEKIGREFPMTESSKYYVGKNYLEVQKLLEDVGFTNVTCKKTTEKGLMTKDGQITDITIDGENGFDKGSWYLEHAEIVLTYYEPETPEEAAAAHEGKIQTPDSSKRYMGRNYKEVMNELQDAGFSEFAIEKQQVKKGWTTKEEGISKISILGQTQFDKGDWFDPKSMIRITYQEVIGEPAKKSDAKNPKKAP